MTMLPEAAYLDVFVLHEIYYASDVALKLPELVYREMLLKYKTHLPQIFDVCSKYARDVALRKQCDDRWEYFVNFSDENDDAGADFLESLLTMNNINVVTFLSSFKFVLQNSHPKIHALVLQGPPNAGKTMLVECMTKPFICGRLSIAGTGSEYYFESLFNTAVNIIEEPFMIPGVIDDFKNILGGQRVLVGKKFQSKQPLSPVPYFITSNHTRFGRGFSSSIDEEAIQRRCVTYHLSAVCNPPCTISPTSMITLIRRYKSRL